MGVMKYVSDFLGGKDESTAFPLLLVHLNIVIYAMAYWMQQPVLPFLAEDLGADKVTFGTLNSAISTCALVGGPMLGTLTDTRGAKIGLIVAQIGSVAMYGLMGMATTLPLLFLSRIPSLLQHAMLCSQAAISKLTPAESRAVAMGRLSLSYGLGMIVGAPIGGMLSRNFGHYTAAGAACVLSVVVVVLDVLFLPSLTASDKNQESKHKKVEGGALSLAKVRAVLGDSKVRNILVYSTIVGFGLSVYRSQFSLVAKEQYNLQADDLGFFMSFAAILSTLANVFLVGPVVQRLGNYGTVLFSSVVLTISYAVFSFVTTYNYLILIKIPMTVASTLLYTVVGSIISTSVRDSESGTAVSMSHASRSFCGIISPILGGRMLDTFGPSSLGISSSAVICVGTLYLIVFAKKSLSTLSTLSTHNTHYAHTKHTLAATSEDKTK